MGANFVAYLPGPDTVARGFVDQLDQASIAPQLVVDALSATVDQGSGQETGSSGESAWSWLRAAGLAVLTVFLVSGAFRAIMAGADRIDGTEHGSRSIVRRWGTSIAIAMVVLPLIGGAIWITALAPGAGEGATALAWDLARWAIALGMIAAAYAVTFRFGPASRHSFRWLSIGGLLTAVAWGLFALAYSAYYSRTGPPSAAYGSYAGIAVAVLYAYYSAFVVLVGHTVNVLLAERAETASRHTARSGQRDRRAPRRRVSAR